MTKENRSNSELLHDLTAGLTELVIGTAATTIEERARNYESGARARARRSRAESLGPTDATAKVTRTIKNRIGERAGLVVNNLLTGATNDLRVLRRKIKG